MNRLLVLLSCICSLAILPCGLNADSVVLTSSADTMIGIRDVNGNPPGDGESDTVSCGTTRQGQTSRVLMRFDISGIPTNATVTNVTFRLVVNQTPQNPQTYPFSLHRLLWPWSESNADWFSTGMQHEWGQPGGTNGIDFIAQPGATNSILGTGAYFFNSPTLLNEVLMWRTNSGTNFGWMILCDTENIFQSAKRFSTREASDPSMRPQLIIEYTTPFSIQLTHPRKVGGQFAFDFAARPGTDYIIQYKDDVTNAWQEFDYYFDPGTETIFTVFDDGTAPKRFFRVISTTTP